MKKSSVLGILGVVLVAGCHPAPPAIPTVARLTAPSPTPASPEPSVTLESPPEWVRLPEPELIQRVERDLEAGRLSDAEDSLALVLEWRPELDDLRLHGAVGLWHVGERQQAVALLEARPATLPRLADHYRLLATMYLELAEDGPNVSHSRDMVTYSPSQDEAADAAWSAEQFHKAEAASQAYLNLAPQEPNAVELRAQTLIQQQRWPEAATVLWEASPVVSQRARLQHLQVQALRKSGRLKDALTQADRYLAVRPRHAELLALVAEVKSLQGDSRAAKEAQSRADFYGFLIPEGTVEYSAELAKSAAVLSSHFAGGGDGAATDKKVKTVLSALIRHKALPSTELLAAFVWHHSHDEFEERAMKELDARGAAADATLERLVEHGQSYCTLEEGLTVLARHRSPRALELLRRNLPRDARFGFPLFVARSMGVLGDQAAVEDLTHFLSRPIPQDVDSMTEIALAFSREQSVLALGVLGGDAASEALDHLQEEPSLNRAAQGGRCILALRRPEAARDPEPDVCRAFEGALTEDDLSSIGLAGQAADALEVRPTPATLRWAVELRKRIPQEE